MPHAANESDVRNRFEKVGKIVKIDLKQGYSFVKFDSSREAGDAVQQLNSSTLMGRYSRRRKLNQVYKADQCVQQLGPSLMLDDADQATLQRQL